MKTVVLVDGLRTPFAKAGKELALLHPADLAAENLKEFLYRLPIKKDLIDEVILGNVANLTDAANIARVSALRAGMREAVSAVTVHRNCASSLESIVQGMAKIQSGMCDVIMAGGVESMSCVPLLFSSPFKDFAFRWLFISKCFLQTENPFIFSASFSCAAICFKGDSHRSHHGIEYG